MPFLLGITGPICAGKGVAADYLTELASRDGYSVTFLQIGDILRAILNLLALELTRENQQKLVQLIEEHWPDQLAESSKRHILSSTSSIIIVCGLRHFEAHGFLLRQLPQQLHIHIDAADETRFDRRALQDDKVRQDELSFEEFCALSEGPTEKDQSRFKEVADIHIQNDGTLETYKNRLEQIYSNVADCVLRLTAR